MTTPIKPWSNHRQVLWAMGVFGLFLLAFGLFMNCVFGGFGPGAQPPPWPGLMDMLGLVLLTVSCVYYIAVAHRVWTRNLWLIGVVIHSLLFIILLIMLFPFSGVRLLVWPIFLIGPLTWILYAKRNRFEA